MTQEEKSKFIKEWFSRDKQTTALKILHKMNTTKKVVKYKNYINLVGDIDKMIERLQNLKKEGFTEIDMDGYGDDSYFATKMAEETTEDWEGRLASEIRDTMEARKKEAERKKEIARQIAIKQRELNELKKQL